MLMIGVEMYERGFDIGNHFCEWMMNNNHEHFPFFEYDFDKYPSRVEQLGAPVS